MPSLDFLPAKQTYNIFSGFAQDNIDLIRNRLSLTLGSKFESTTFSGFNYQPSGRVTWTPDDNRTAWVGVTRAVRTPSEIEDGFRFSFLAQPNVPLYLRLIGDGGFQPEKLVSYEVGYREYLNRRGFINFSLFHNRYNGLESVESGPVLVETAPVPTHLVLPLSLRNGIRASSTGGEAVAVWDPKLWWRLRGSYSLVLVDAARKRGSNDASTVGQLEGDTPKHTAVIQSSFQLPMRLDLNIALRYVSNIPDQRAPAYFTGDARLGWRWGGPWEFEVAGQNLFQPSHVEYGGDPGPLVGIGAACWAESRGGINYRFPGIKEGSLTVAARKRAGGAGGGGADGGRSVGSGVRSEGGVPVELR